MMLLLTAAPGTAPARAATATPASITHRVSAPTGDAAGNGSAGVCGAARPGHVRCLAEVSTRLGRVESSALSAGPLPNSYSPADLTSAYRLPSAGGRGHVLAVVLAFDDPSAEADLAVYRAQYSLPPCTSVNGCLRKVDQQGGTHYPPPQVNWATETSLDLDMASAACPLCSILLVEAHSDVLKDVFQAVHEALALGATEVSLSFGVPEYPAERQDDALFNHPGVPIVAASGDSGYGVNYPAASPYVTAVGGTSLRPSTDPRGWSETAWGGGGSGCSAYETKPAWQADTGCSRRTVVDVSAVADPGTGVAVYNTYAAGGWMRVGGTSAAAPIVAAGYALRGANPAAPGASTLYQPGAADDVVSGSNGVCTPSYLCTAQPGYDGPTGMGSIHGTANPAAPAGAAGFVSRVYQDLLARPPDAGGLAYWSGLIDGGQPRYPVATSLTASTEYRGLQVQALYSKFLHRATDGTTGSGGEGFWVGYIARGQTFEQLAESLIGSDEYFHLRGNDDNLTYVRVLYNDILGRGPEAGGLAYWGGRLNAGAPRYLVSASILNSGEGYQNLVRGVFQHFLGHQPDAGGLAYWTSHLQSGLRDELLIASIIATDEYFGKP